MINIVSLADSFEWSHWFIPYGVVMLHFEVGLFLETSFVET
jgi:hypothetical protein